MLRGRRLPLWGKIEAALIRYFTLCAPGPNGTDRDSPKRTSGRRTGRARNERRRVCPPDESADQSHDGNYQWTARHHWRYCLASRTFFGTSAEFWLNLQTLYNLRLAERKAGKAIKALPTLKDHELLGA